MFLNEVLDLNTLVTPPNYKTEKCTPPNHKTDRCPFKEIKTGGGGGKVFIYVKAGQEFRN